MTTTMEKTEFVEFASWQSVRKLANEIGVNFYSSASSSYDMGHGYGLEWNRLFHDRIDIRGWNKTYGNSDHDRRMVQKLGKENLQLKLELWAIKNNVEYVYVKNTRDFGYDYIQIVKKAN